MNILKDRDLFGFGTWSWDDDAPTDKYSSLSTKNHWVDLSACAHIQPKGFYLTADIHGDIGDKRLDMTFGLWFFVFHFTLAFVRKAEMKTLGRP